MFPPHGPPVALGPFGDNLGPARILSARTLTEANAGHVPPALLYAGSPLKFSCSSRLHFTGPFNHRTRSTITMTNESPVMRVAFKVKSTASKGRIAVKPPKGVVEPEQTVTVHFTLMPVSLLPDCIPPSYRLRIESTCIDRTSVDLDEIFSGRDEQEITVTKFNLVYNMPMSSTKEISPKEPSHRAVGGGGEGHDEQNWNDQTQVQPALNADGGLVDQPQGAVATEYGEWGYTASGNDPVVNNDWNNNNNNHHRVINSDGGNNNHVGNSDWENNQAVNSDGGNNDYVGSSDWENNNPVATEGWCNVGANQDSGWGLGKEDEVSNKEAPPHVFRADLRDLCLVASLIFSFGMIMGMIVLSFLKS